MKCDELKSLVFSIKDLAYVDEHTIRKNFENTHDHAVYKATEVDAAITELKEEILNLKAKNIELQSFYDLHGNVDNYIDKLKAKNRRLKRALCLARAERATLNVKDAAHVLKAFKLYLCQLTHCAYDELTAQWILDNWEQDYKRVEEYKG